MFFSHSIPIMYQNSAKSLYGPAECNVSAINNSSKFSRANQITDEESCDYNVFYVSWPTGEEWSI